MRWADQHQHQGQADAVSNWQIQKKKSRYHFDTLGHDPTMDAVFPVARFDGDFSQAVEEAKQRAQPRTWRDRGRQGQPNALVGAEEYDLEAAGADPQMQIADITYELPEICQRMVSIIGLERSENRLHVQWPGQSFLMHIDKLEKMNPDSPERVMRIMVALTPWLPGQFNSYGNFLHTHYLAGDIFYFDWQHVPHASANASLMPRVSLLTTGTVGEKTREFLELSRQRRLWQI